MSTKKIDKYLELAKKEKATSKTRDLVLFLEEIKQEIKRASQ